MLWEPRKTDTYMFSMVTSFTVCNGGGGGSSLKFVYTYNYHHCFENMFYTVLK